MQQEIQVEEKPALSNKVTWNPFLGVVYVVLIYLASQVVGLSVLLYPAIMRWSTHQSNDWLNHSVLAQFLYVLIAETFTVVAILFLLKAYKVDKKVIGLRKAKLKDPLYGILAFVPYYILYIGLFALISVFYHGINVSQHQNVGFSNVHGIAPLIITFISLVILPPIAEEIMFRGFLYSSLKKGIRIIPAALVTSIIFASLHLGEGVGGAFWIGAIDTFTLSIVLITLRELTGGLWASMTLHGLKNGIAFVVIYITPLVALHH